jgi:L-asparaginase
MKRVMIVATGGTVLMKYDPVTKGAVPSISGSELVAAVPELESISPVEVVEFSNVPSSNVTPQVMWKLAEVIRAYLEDDEVAGVVVAHGTDTLEETAYFLDLVLELAKPVCMTAALRSASAPSTDGPSNLIAAVRTAASPYAVGYGTLVVMNEEIHAARDVTKSHASRLHAFASPAWGPLGVLDEHRVIFRSSPVKRSVENYPGLVDHVYLLKMTAGSDDLLLRCLIKHSAKGIVIEGLGRGNIPPAVLPGIKDAIAAGIPVVLATRTLNGFVLDVYGYPGGGRDLKNMGVIFAGDLSGPKARLKLMLALSITRQRDELEAIFAKA